VSAGRRLAAEAVLVVEGLGAAGDGIGRLGQDTVDLPFGLPGERWRVRLAPRRGGAMHATGIERLSGLERQEPPCPHFGLCGGCALQHLPDAVYRDLKTRRALAPLDRLGLRPDVVRPIAVSPLASRRRVRFAWQRRGDRAHLGYRSRRGHDIVDIGCCPIALPAIQALLGPLRACLAGLGPAGGELLVTATAEGPDLLLVTRERLDLADRERLASFAQLQDLARMAVGAPGDALPLVIHRQPTLTLGDIAVHLPAGAFLQATQEGERALQAAIADWLPEEAVLVDLFAGLGTLSLPLTRRTHRIRAYERDAAPVEALQAAARRAPRPGVTAVRRDLERDPLLPAELADAGFLVLDPPRAGARAQIEALADGPPRIAYASCHPGSFARDAALLAARGWRLAELRPIDQFLYSAEVELVALFRRGPPPEQA
jgi:23S rRNA (uracil1939-C5)-methyltransferase